MTEKQNLQLFLLRYMPNVLRGEFVNFGAILVNENGDLSGVRFTQDWRRIECLLPDADVDALHAMQAHLQNELRDPIQWNEFYRIFKSYVSSGFELTLPVAVITNDVAREIELISKFYLEPLRASSIAKATGRNAILQAMKKEFEQAGVLNLLQQRTSAAPYTVAEDPFTIDYLYQVGSVVKMFQAVPVSGQGESAVALAYRCPRIAAGLRNQQRDLLMTAVVEDTHDLAQQSVAFALHLLQEANVRVANVGEMSAIAETVRNDLHA